MQAIKDFKRPITDPSQSTGDKINAILLIIYYESIIENFYKPQDRCPHVRQHFKNALHLEMIIEGSNNNSFNLKLSYA